jgi:threonine synthase
MECVSTRGGAVANLTDAISQGLAADGGLFIPRQLPRVPALTPGSLPEVATALLAPFFDGEPLAAQLADICIRAFNFAAPVVRRKTSTDDSTLELFHGPTAAFKDFGARFLAEVMSRTPGPSQRTVLVATSGDTGAAVAAAFHRRPGFRVVVLYPDGRVSKRQAHVLGAFGDNVQAFRVQGSFDDCQRLVKAAFNDPVLRHELALTSANSISLGRLLPQMAYYAHASLALGGEVNVVVPSGNLGNALACLFAKWVGLPLGRVVLATNANRVLHDFLESGSYVPRDSLATLANAMDVGAPSNLERLRAMVPDLAQLRQTVASDWVSDEQIRETIARTWREEQYELCPHTACGVEVLWRLRAKGATGRWLVAATAHPAKFETVVEPLVGHVVKAPASLQAWLEAPAVAEPLAPDERAFAEALRR